MATCPNLPQGFAHGRGHFWPRAGSSIEEDQGEISGLSRSVSNLGSSLGTALVGSVLVAVALPKGKPFAVALAILLVIALIGLVLAVLIPRQPIRSGEPADSDVALETRPSVP